MGAGVLETGAHWAAVAAAYGATAVILGAIVWASVAESRRARRDLDRLDREGRP